MCTVSFIPVAGKYYITSNRDEKILRKQAMPPAEYFEDGIKLIFPKDGEAGGTWIALNENGNSAVLLNGGFVAHIPQPPYTRSRGVVLLDIIKDDTSVKYFLAMNLVNIEPFTILLFENGNLFECRWDGSKKYIRQLKNHKPYIWSSVTLYDEAIRKKREEWFAEFLNNNLLPSQEDIFHFHQFTGDGDKRNDLHMSRDEIYTTVSITSIEINDEMAGIQYLDLADRIRYKKEMPFIPLHKVA